ncbi:MULTISPECIES: hypothetical protein [unclassified Streptomyces]|uniref:hypothetical protein n=1 Tax=unclassified Streptomyces TaxID=2593676 RepID=UPI003D8EAB54
MAAAGPDLAGTCSVVQHDARLRPPGPYVQVRALDAHGRVLRASKVVKLPG